ncbi:unnamed protein product [Ophioblennius macclurei]
MSSPGGAQDQFLYTLPSYVITDFCRAMDALPDPDWTRFAAAVLSSTTDVRLAERRERRTDWVVAQLENRNERVGHLVALLERLQLLRQRDIILGWSPAPLPAPPPTAPPSTAPPPSLGTVQLSKAGGGAVPLPPPAPPPFELLSGGGEAPADQQAQAACSSAAMSWCYEEVHAGTAGFSSAQQVGEGGFGVVYRATLSNIDCAVKRLREDGQLDWRVLQESFLTEVDQLSRFRHPHIVDLLGFSIGGGSMCLIYSYMHNRSLEDQLHSSAGLSWSQRVRIVTGASAALQFLHCPPGGLTSLIHGDVKSSNILLDRHLEAKLSDFGLARFRPGGPTTQTASVGQTETVRGTLAYLPDEYVRSGELGTPLDVFSFGVVLLEVLTGRRALQKDGPSTDRYLKDLVEELEEDGSASSPDVWTKLLDPRLTSGGVAQKPVGCLQMAALACRCLRRVWKKRPKMKEVFENLENIHRLVGGSSRPLDWPLGQPSRPESSLGAVVHQLSRLGPLEDTDLSLPSSSSSSSSRGSLASPHPLHSASSLPPTSSSSSSSSSYTSSSYTSLSSSFLGPCETDESRGFSQYFRSTGTSSLSLPPPRTQNQHRAPPGLAQNQKQDRVSALPGPLREEASAGPQPRERGFHAGSLQSTSPGLSDGRAGPEDLRGPEESDELDFLPAQRH